MGWFNKKETKKEEIASLPELPKLPEFPKIKGKINDLPEIHQLPSFPNNSLGEKFSQNAIKEAVSGKKEGEEVFEADDFAPTEDEMLMMQKPLKKPLTKEIPFFEKGNKKTSKEFKEVIGRIKKTKPIFIRIDQFEESLNIFEETKKKILEIEKMLEDTKKIKEEEGKELEFWESEIQTIKGQIEKIDKNIFSKIE